MSAKSLHAKNDLASFSRIAVSAQISLPCVPPYIEKVIKLPAVRGIGAGSFAYCRVSTADETTENQVQEIAAAGFAVTKARTIVETVSGNVAAKERKIFARLLDELEGDDVLIVTKLDRLGRNAMDVRATVEYLEAAGVRVHCLALGGVDLTSPAGKMTMQVINAVAEFERDLLIERTSSGIKRARAEGTRFGRPPVLTDAQRSEVLALLAQSMSVAQIARQFETTRQTIMRIRAT